MSGEGEKGEATAAAATPSTSVWPEVLFRDRKRPAVDTSDPRKAARLSSEVTQVERFSRSPAMREDYERKLGFFKSMVEGQHKYLLHFAVEVGDLEAVDAAIRLGCSVELEDEEGRTPMYLAALEGKRSVMDVLKKRGGDVGKVLEVGASRGQRAVIELALSCGAEVDRTDEEGRSPLYRAAEGGHLDTMQLLLEKGAQFGSSLHLAAARGHLQAASSLLSSGACVRGEDGEGRSALYRAAQGGNQDIITLLLDKGAGSTYLLHSALKAGDLQVVKHLMLYATARNESVAKLQKALVEEERKQLSEMLNRGANVGSLLHTVARSGNGDNVNWLLTRGADVNYRDARGYPPLYVAAEAGNVDMMKTLMAGGAALEAEVGGKRLLHRAVEGKDRIAAEALLVAGADVNYRDARGYPPLYAAAETGNVDMMKTLMARGAALEAEVGGKRLLYCAVEVKDRTAAGALLEAGADVNSTTSDTERGTSLHLAAKDNSVDIIDMLLRYGAAVDVRDGGDVTPLMLAARGGHVGPTRALLERGAAVNMKDKYGQTALYYAAGGGHLEVVRVLLAAGADTYARFGDGCTALHCAADGGHLEVVRVLLAAGADIHARFDCGRTALDIATLRGHRATAALLRSWPNDTVP